MLSSVTVNFSRVSVTRVGPERKGSVRWILESEVMRRFCAKTLVSTEQVEEKLGESVHVRIDAGALGTTFYLLTFIVRPLLVTHVLILLFSLRTKSS